MFYVSSHSLTDGSIVYSVYFRDEEIYSAVNETDATATAQALNAALKSTAVNYRD
jgi:hypothetical protein